jgi:imidazolonepropionase-like amidohydrolase
VALRDEVNAGRILGPRFVFVNDHDIGGQGSQEVVERVKEVVKLGISDWIGVGVTGGYTSNQPLVMKRTFDEVETAVKVAHANGKKVDAMVENAEGCKLSVKAGVDCMTHGMLLNDESLEMMRKANMYWSPILLTRAASCELDLAIRDSDVNMSGLPKSDKLKWIQTMKDRLEVLKKNVKKGHEMGIKMLAGSDIPPPRVEAVIIQNDTMIREMEMLREWSGMTPMEALMTGTKYCGDCLAMPIGTLEKGKLADIIITEGNPLRNLRKALDPTNIWMVMKEGAIVHTKYTQHVVSTYRRPRNCCLGSGY